MQLDNDFKQTKKPEYINNEDDFWYSKLDGGGSGGGV